MVSSFEAGVGGDVVDLSALDLGITYAELETLMDDSTSDIEIDLTGINGGGVIILADIDNIADLDETNFIL